MVSCPTCLFKKSWTVSNLKLCIAKDKLVFCIFSKRDLTERESASHLITGICPFSFGYYDFLILQCSTYGIFEVPNELKVFTTDTGIHILTYLLKSYKLKSTWGAEKKALDVIQRVTYLTGRNFDPTECFAVATQIIQRIPF